MLEKNGLQNLKRFRGLRWLGFNTIGDSTALLAVVSFRLVAQYRPARKNICHKKLRLDLLGPIRNRA